MTNNEFREETANLEGFYNKKLNNFQLQFWFDELKYYSVEKYKKAINTIVKTNQYMPALSVILDVMRRTKEVVDLSKPKVECKLCKGFGIFTYKKRIDGIEYEYACQCNCENAVGMDYDGSKIADKEHRSNYYLAKAVDVFARKPSKAFDVNAVDYDISQINF